MLTASRLLPGAGGVAPALVRRAARVALDWDVRQKSRFDAVDTHGRTLGVFLPRGTVVRGGDLLVAEDGSMIVVDAAAEPVMIVTACPEHGTPSDLARAAYHLGNRHVALEVRPDHLKLTPDHVLAAMLRRMHLIVRDAEAAFEPEAGAYAAVGHAHAGDGHGHDHGDDHAHGHAHAHAHAIAHDHAHGHEHDPPHDPHDHGGTPA